MIDVEHCPLRAFEQNRLALRQRLIQQHCGIRHKRRNLSRRLRVFRIHLVGIERLGVEQRVRNHVFLAHRVFDMLLQQLQVKQIGDPQPAPPHLVLVCRTNPARCCPNLYATGRILRRQFDHAVIRQNHLGAIRDK